MDRRNHILRYLKSDPTRRLNIIAVPWDLCTSVPRIECTHEGSIICPSLSICPHVAKVDLLDGFIEKNPLVDFCQETRMIVRRSSTMGLVIVGSIMIFLGQGESR